jgi:hypothetical protein
LTESQGLSCPVQTSLEQKENQVNEATERSLRRRPDAEMSELDIKTNTFHGDWNYEIRPRNSRRQLR